MNRVIVLVFTLASLVCSWQSGTLDLQPRATADISGMMINPSVLGFTNESSTHLGLTTVEDRDVSSFSLMHRESKFGLSYQRLFDDPTTSYRLALASAAQIFPQFSLGFRGGYEGKSGAKNLWTGDIGLTWQPFSLVRLAYASERLWTSQEDGEDPSDHLFELALRPLAPISNHASALTLGVQRRYERWPEELGQDYRETFFARVQLPYGIALQGSYHKERFQLGFTIQTDPQSAFHYTYDETKDQEYQSEWSLELGERSRPQFFAPPRRAAKLDLNRSIVEKSVAQNIFSQSNQIGFLDLLDHIDLIEQTTAVTTVVVETGRTQSGWGMATEIRARLQRMRSQGKKVVAYMENITPISYYIASACESIAVQPSAYFNLPGFSSEVAFFRGFLEKIGVETQFVRRGAYKAFPEPFTRDSMSVEYRENLTQILSSLDSHFVAETATARNLTTDSLKTLLATPDISLQNAQQAGLIDTLLQEDEVLQWSAGRWSQYHSLKGGIHSPDIWRTAPKIAVVTIEGGIVSGESDAGFLTNGNAGSETLVKQLKKVRKDPSVQAVVLRINSPGGSAQASDIIEREIELLVESGKPVVASVGNVAASGGYYLLSSVEKVFVQPNSIVGSIGIYSGKVVLAGLYEKLGVTSETVKTAPFADAQSMSRPWSEEEVAAVQGYMDHFYDRFVGKVQNGRKIDSSRIVQVTEGRVFTGSQAVELGLADEIGGIEAAIDHAKKSAGFDSDRFVTVVQSKGPDRFGLQASLEGTFSQAKLPALMRELQAWQRIQVLAHSFLAEGFVQNP